MSNVPDQAMDAGFGVITQKNTLRNQQLGRSPPWVTDVCCRPETDNLICRRVSTPHPPFLAFSSRTPDILAPSGNDRHA